MDKQTFKEKKDQFINFLSDEKSFSKNTCKSYYLDLQQFLYFWEKQELIENQKLNFDQMLNKYNNILNTNQINSTSIARKVSCINSFKTYLKTHGIEVKSKIYRPKVTVKKPQYLNIEELFDLLDNIKSENLPTKFPLRDKAIIEIIYATGVRCSELVNIELSCIDFQNRSIIIRTKNQKERVVFFGVKAYKALLEYLKFERSSIKNNYEKLFLNYQSGPLTVRSIQRICKMFRTFLKNKFTLTPQALRNSFALHMLQKGATIDYMQELLGHRSKASTQRYLEIALKNTNSQKLNEY